MTTTTMTAIDTGPARSPRSPRAEKTQPQQQPLSPRDGVNTNQQLAGGVGANLVPATPEKKQRKAFTRTPYITEETHKDVQQILVVLNANFVNKTFRLAELMEKLPEVISFCSFNLICWDFLLADLMSKRLLVLVQPY